ncbi:MAG TPA: hypothetical protein VGF94_00120 [Kofleriaceae bacterium]|jgi:serine/threonine-protein kinase
MRIAKLVSLLFAVLLAVPARAQSVEAEVLFREGKKLLKSGHLSEACDKLEASDRLESSVGTLLNLADCRERNHQLATAWATFRKAAAAAKRGGEPKREAEARRREKLLDAKLSYLAIHVRERSDGLAITRNGSPVDPELWDQSIPIDAGDYDIAATAPGRVRWLKHVAIASEGEKIDVHVPVLESKGPPPTEPQPPDKPVAATREAAPPPAGPPPPPPSTFTGKRKLALVLALAGAAGIAGGTAFAVHGQHLEHESDAVCPTTTCNDPRALSLNSDARHAALDANLGFVAGGAVLAGSIVLWFVGGPASIEPVVAPDRVGIAFARSF